MGQRFKDEKWNHRNTRLNSGRNFLWSPNWGRPFYIRHKPLETTKENFTAQKLKIFAWQRKESEKTNDKRRWEGQTVTKYDALWVLKTVRLCLMPRSGMFSASYCQVKNTMIVTIFAQKGRKEEWKRYLCVWICAKYLWKEREDSIGSSGFSGEGSGGTGRLAFLPLKSEPCYLF